MATKNLSDEDIEDLKRSLSETTAFSLKLDHISLFLATLALVVGTGFVIGGTIWDGAWWVVTGIGLIIWALWVRSSVAQTRLKRIETAFALHLLGYGAEVKTDGEEVE